jgi:hypothetical protein
MQADRLCLLLPLPLFFGAVSRGLIVSRCSDIVGAFFVYQRVFLAVVFTSVQSVRPARYLD